MTPASVLYSLRIEIDREGATRYRITKFVDGEVESSYHTSREACECPAGVRPTCRHRQMLPQMLNADIANTHWFYDHDHGGRIVDFEGTTREFYEHIEATLNHRPHSVTVSTGDFDSPSGGSNPPAVATTPAEAAQAMSECDYWNGRKSLSEATTPAASPAKHPWRRL